MHMLEWTCRIGRAPADERATVTCAGQRTTTGSISQYAYRCKPRYVTTLTIPEGYTYIIRQPTPAPYYHHDDGTNDSDRDGRTDDQERDGYVLFIDESGFGIDPGTLTQRTVTSDPNDPDTDDDGLDDYEEFMFRSDPRTKDTDGDGLDDHKEVKQWLTSPTSVDTDGDCDPTLLGKGCWPDNGESEGTDILTTDPPMKQEETFLQHPVPQAILEQIGDITVSFATLELTMQMLTGALIAEHQRVGQIITAELSFKNLRALLTSLYIERHGRDDDYQDLCALNKRAEKLEAARNRITHSAWGAAAGPDATSRLKTTAKETRGLRFDFEQMDVAGFKAIADEMKRVANGYVKFFFHLVQNGKAINNPTRKIW